MEKGSSNCSNACSPTTSTIMSAARKSYFCRGSEMDPEELLLTAARAFAVYVLMLVVIRALGKRTIGNFAAFDLLVALMLGEVVDEIIYGDVLFLQGSVAIVAIAALAYADSWLAFLHPSMEALLEGKPTIIVRDGRLDRKSVV